MVVCCARDIPGAPCACANTVQRVMHRIQHIGVLTHSQIIVGAPNCHIPFRPPIAIDGLRKGTSFAFQISKNTVVTLITKRVEF